MTVNHQFQSWISDGTWKIINATTNARRNEDREAITKLKKELRKGLKQDRKN
jgi:hypothetical protein